LFSIYVFLFLFDVRFLSSRFARDNRLAIAAYAPHNFHPA